MSFLVGMGRYIVRHNPSEVSCLGLGSCVGVFLYDKVSKKGGVAHVMLPAKKETVDPSLIKIQEYFILNSNNRKFYDSSNSKKITTAELDELNKGILVCDNSVEKEKILSLVKTKFFLKIIYIANKLEGETSLESLYNEGVEVIEPSMYLDIKKALNHFVNKAKINPKLKQADIAIENMLEELNLAGSSKKNIVAKIAGGAHMFAGKDVIDIGKQNVLSVKEVLKEKGIKIISEDTLGNLGRTVLADIKDGSYKVKTKKEVKII